MTGTVAVVALLLSANQQAGVEQVITNVLDAWRRADARAIAAQYEPDGDFVSPGEDHAVGRNAIEAFYKAAFEHGYAGSGATAKIVHTRAISGSLALVDGSWTIDPTAASKITRPESGHFVALVRLHGSRWWIVALREQ
jgi:uncharacterized protein (TIGR02246 family)